MRPTTIENATIESVFIGIEDHGILTMFIHLKGAGWGVGYGGFALDKYDPSAKARVGHALLADAVIALLAVFRVRDIANLQGLPCRVETEGWGGQAIRVGHFMENRWFSFQQVADKALAQLSAAGESK